MTTPPINAAISAGLAALDAVTGVAITYTRGAATATMTATKGRTEHEALNEDGMAEIADSVDWMIDAADLLLPTRTLPIAGDTITEVDAAGTHTYRVGVPFGAAQPWRYSDHHRLRLRVHSIQHGTT